MYKTILYEARDRVLTITLNRPEKLNAFSDVMANELIDALDRSDADDGIGVVIVTGAGRGFCSGADLKLGADTFNYASLGRGGGKGAKGGVDYSHESVRDSAGRVTLRIFRSLKPVIGAINGAAIGVGITMTLAMDFRLAVNTAKIGFVFTRLGIVPEGASSWFLPRIVGIGKALEWTLTGRIIDAAEAYQGGLLRSLHQEGELLPAAHAIARDIVEHTAPVSVALTRQMFWRSLGQTHPMDAHRIDSRGVYARGGSKDAVEGVTSFLSKRAPVYCDTVSTDMPDFFPWWTDPPYE